jgi:hypothetical protein
MRIRSAVTDDAHERNPVMRKALCVIAIVATAACDAASMAAFLEGYNRGMQNAAMPSGKLMVFGGRNNDVYLGCLNCSQYASDSLLNAYGTHGNKYAANGLLNKFSPYGSRYSALSACNPYAANPPIVVDQNGRAYGRLTMNASSANRITWTAVTQWLAGVCAD